MRTTQSSYTADPDLRARLQAFTPDEPGVVFPFSARLAREQGWTREHARRVVREYLRFVYLAATAGHPVTPSKAVDEAWHLHLTYTRSYWDDLCGRVLGRPLHHEPTRGGTDEDAKFAGWYARTLDSYRAAFGQEPPADIWPRPGTPPRVTAPASAPTDSRVPSIPMSRGAAVTALVAGGVLAALGTARADAVAAAAITLPGVMMTSVALFGAWLVISAFRQVRRQPPHTSFRQARERRQAAGGVGVNAGWAGYDPGTGWSTDPGYDSGDGGSDRGSDGGCGDGGGTSCGSGCGSSCGGGGG